MGVAHSLNHNVREQITLKYIHGLLQFGLFYSTTTIADSNTDRPIMLYHLSKYCGVTSHSSFTTTTLYAYDNHKRSTTIVSSVRIIIVLILKI